MVYAHASVASPFSRLRWSLLGLCLLLATAMPGPVSAQAEYSEQELEQRLEQAREQLDEAARQLAELNRAKYSKYGHDHKKPTRAMLGIVINDEGKKGGIRLHGLTPGGGAVEAGMKTGDVIVAVNGFDLGSKGKSPLGNLNKVMKDITAGDTVVVRYRRDGAETDVNVVTRGRQRDVKALISKLEDELDIKLDLEGLEAELAAAAESVAMGAAAVASIEGMGFADAKVIRFKHSTPMLVTVDKDLGSYFGVEQGVLVVDAPDDAGDIVNGDILLALDGKPMSDVTIARAVLAEAGDRELSARVRRQGREQSARVNAGAFTQFGRIARAIRVEKDGGEMSIIVEDDDED